MADMTSTEREAAIIEAYRSGAKVSAIQERYGVARSTLYHILRRSGVTPKRTREQTEAATGDARLAGLAELISHQDRMLQESQHREAALTRRVAKLERENHRLKTQLGDGATVPRRRQHQPHHSDTG